MRVGKYGDLAVRQAAGLGVALVFGAAGLPAQGDVVLSDMSRCRPAGALSPKLARGKWRLIPYEAEGLGGVMLAAPSFIAAPSVTLPLGAAGWHAVYAGIWHPEYAYDGEPVVKLRLSSAPAFRRIHAGATPDTQDKTFLREVFVCHADVTGQDLVIGKSNGPLGQSAFLAYVRLVPLGPDEVARIEADRARKDTRDLVATIDGMSFFHYGECRRPEHVQEQVELYRHSDVGKVLWAVNYGHQTNYPTRVPGAAFLGGGQERVRLAQVGGANDYVRGEKQLHETLRSFARRGILAQQVAAKHAHEMGLRFDLMFRLGIIGEAGGLRMSEESFVQRNPHLRLLTRDGTVLNKASYAFPEVRQLMLSLVREATGLIDADGVNLCFVRGPHFVLYEQPVLDAFRKAHGLDARSVAPDDPRLLAVRAGFLTDFVRQVRGALDEIGRKKGRRLELSVWVWPGGQNVWLGKTPLEEGLDVPGWIREKLLDSVICQEGIDPAYIEAGKQTGCRFVLFTGYRGEQAMSPETVTRAYQAGVDAFAYWDIDSVQIYPSAWNWIRRIGHREEMADWARHDPGERLVRLRKVGSADVLNGLADAVYSGG